MDKTGFIPSFWADARVVVEDDEGNEHELQPGARVRFRRDVPLEYVQAMGRTSYVEYAEWMPRVLCRQVLEWTGWTDARGRPYPPRFDEDGGDGPFIAALLDLMPEERGWLLTNCWQQEQSEVPND